MTKNIENGSKFSLLAFQENFMNGLMVRDTQSRLMYVGRNGGRAFLSNLHAAMSLLVSENTHSSINTVKLTSIQPNGGKNKF